MALHTELPIYRTGVRLLDIAVKAQVQMPRTVKRVLGEKITQHCVEMLDLMALANASQRDARKARSQPWCQDAIFGARSASTRHLLAQRDLKRLAAHDLDD